MPAPSPGMAAAQSAERQTAPSPGAVTPERFLGIGRAGRLEPATHRRPKHHPDHRRQQPTVSSDQQQQDEAHTGSAGRRPGRLRVPEAGLPQATAQITLHHRQRPAHKRGPGHEDDVRRTLDRMLMPAERLPQETPRAIAYDRPAQPARRHHAEAKPVGGRQPAPVHDQAATHPALPLLAGRRERTGTVQSLTAAQPQSTVVGGRGHGAQTCVRRARPSRRRLRITDRPLLVDMRARNPN